MASNSDDDSPPPPPPPDSSPSHSPPPPSQDNSSPPPPPPSSPSPPPPSSPPPSSPPPSPSPPPPTDGKKSPPPPSGSSPSPPPPPPPPEKKSGSHSPPPPSGNTFSPPPPPSRHRLTPPRNSSGTESSERSGGGGNSLNVPAIIGVAAGLVVFLLLLLAIIIACSRRKKKTPAPIYYDDGYFKHGGGGQNQYGYNNNDEHILNIPPPPGVIWAAPAPLAPQRVNSDLSNSSFSGPHGPVLPPPHPTVALGFNQSSFTYDELSAATGGFAQRNLLGQGGFGYVHKGILPNGKEIAVKSLKSSGGQGDREFQAEVDIISRVHHRHLVSLVGYSITDSKKLLVYEFVPNKTLEFHLHGKGRPVMDWGTRLKIAVGSAKGLAYLHEDCHPRIIHRDIKAANILIENNFEAKVADFGLAKFTQDTNTHVSTRVMGTFGYLAPEYASSGKLTDKSDVFSFGVMLLELITGRRPVDRTGDEADSLVDWSRPLCAKALENGTLNGLVDPRLEDNYNRQQMICMVACAAASFRHSAKRRPRMSQIVRVLEGDVSQDVLNVDGVIPGQSGLYSSTSGNYDADMAKFKKLAFGSSMASSELGVTSEYGLNPSTSSSEQSSTEYDRRTGSRMHTP